MDGSLQSFAAERSRRPSWSTDCGHARRHGRGAFTLIEVLVVVAIIALLISVLLPSLRQAREQARTVTCAANMRTSSQAMTLYAASNRDFFPYDHSQATSPGAGLSVLGINCWEFFHKYVQRGTPGEFKNWGKCPRITTQAPNKYYAYLEWYTCPNDKYYHTSNIRRNVAGKTEVEYMLSYCVTLNIPYDIDYSKPNPLRAIRKMSSVKRPASKMLLSEVGDDVASLERKGWEKRDRNDVNNQIGFQIQHQGSTGGSNIVYLDNHVQFHKALLGAPPWYGLPPANAASFEDFAVYDRTKPATASNLITDRAPPEP